jgi:pimeloyl-ACP methyl ester carboxylesterase
MAGSWQQISPAHPERVSRMVLLAPGIPNFGPPTLQWAKYGMPMMFLPSQFTVSRFLDGASTKGYSKEDPVHQQMIIGLMNMRKLSFMRPAFTDEELNGMTVPVLLLLGDHEIMYEPRKALDHAAGLIPISGRTHSRCGTHAEQHQPKLVNARILSSFV